MLKKCFFIAWALALGAAPLMAQEEGMMPPPPPPHGPHLMIPLGPDFMPPEDGPDAFLDAAIARLDKDGDGMLSKDEIKAAWEAMHAMMPPPEGTMPPPEGMMPPPEGMMPPPEGMMGVSEGDEGLEGRPHPPECSDEVRDSELLPQQEGVTCGDHEGNLIFRTVCNMPPYNAQAISLPEGRAADCFGIEAIKGHNIVFEIVEEASGAVMFNTSMGKPAFDTLVLVGGPGGTVYQIRLVSAMEPDAALTIRFLDHPTF